MQHKMKMEETKYYCIFYNANNILELFSNKKNTVFAAKVILDVRQLPAHVLKEWNNAEKRDLEV